MRKKILSLLTVLTMAVFTFPLSAFGTDEAPVAMINGEECYDLQIAFNSLSSVSDPIDVTLLRDIELTETLRTMAGTINLDLNGKTISIDSSDMEDVESTSMTEVIAMQIDSTNMTIVDSSSDQDGGIVAVNNDQDREWAACIDICGTWTNSDINTFVTIEDGIFRAADVNGACSAIRTNAGTDLTIEGGSFTGGSTLNFEGIVSVTGGKFTYDPSPVVPSGCEVVLLDDYYVVSEKGGNVCHHLNTGASGICPDCGNHCPASLLSEGYLSFFTSVEQLESIITHMYNDGYDDTCTIKLLDDISFPSGFTFSEDHVTIDLNGHTLSSTGQNWPAITPQYNADLTIIDSVGTGSVHAEDNLSGCISTWGIPVHATRDARLTIRGGVYDQRIAIGGSITITGGTFEKYVGGDGLTVSGGTFKSGSTLYTLGHLAISGGTFESGSGASAETIAITGGRFAFDPSAYVPSGYEVKQSGGYYAVSKKTVTPPADDDDDGRVSSGSASVPSTGNSKGWDDIAEEIGTAGSVAVDMGTSATVPSEVLDTMASADSTVSFETKKGTWTIDGSSVPADVKDVDLTVKTSSSAPDALKEEAKAAESVVNVRLDDSFAESGIEANLTVDTGKKSAGKAADIYVIDENGEAKLLTSVPVDADGKVDLPVGGAEQYVCVINEKGTLEPGWQKNADGQWLYGTETGTAAAGWVKDGSSWYLMSGHGFMQTGWQKDTDGSWYYLHDSGAMKTGWLKDSDGKWYYLQSSGSMKANGWIQSGGEWYYVGPSGAMLTDTVTPDGYRVDASGKWIR